MRCLVAILAICLFAISNGQTKPNGFDSKHLEIRCDKFRDQTVINTKSMNIRFNAGKSAYLCSMAIGYSVRNAQKSSLAIFLAPGASGFLAHLNASLDPGLTRVFFHRTQT
jgi:hypothetical protein